MLRGAQIPEMAKALSRARMTKEERKAYESREVCRLIKVFKDRYRFHTSDLDCGHLEFWHLVAGTPAEFSDFVGADDYHCAVLAWHEIKKGYSHDPH